MFLTHFEWRLWLLCSRKNCHQQMEDSQPILVWECEDILTHAGLNPRHMFAPGTATTWKLRWHHEDYVPLSLSLAFTLYPYHSIHLLSTIFFSFISFIHKLYLYFGSWGPQVHIIIKSREPCTESFSNQRVQLHLQYFLLVDTHYFTCSSGAKCFS